MALAPHKSAAGLVLLVSLVAAGASIVIQQVPALKPTVTGSEEPIPAVVDQDQPPPEKEEPARQDWAGDPLPPGALARMGTSRLRHYTNAGLAIAFSPDSSILATGSHDSVCLWSLGNGKLLTRIENEGEVYPFAFSPNGKLLAITSGRTVRLWDLISGRTVSRIPAESSLPNAASALAFSLDGKVLAIAIHQGEISLWETGTGRRSGALDTWRGALDTKATSDHISVYYLRFTPDGRTLVSMAFDPKIGEHICHWDLATRTPRKRVAVPKRYGTVPLSSDCKLIAAPAFSGPPGGGIVRLWDAFTGQESCVLQGELNRARYGVDFSRDGKMLATTWTEEESEESTLSLWDTTTGKAIRRFPIPSRTASHVQFSPDGRLLVTCGYGPPSVWDAVTGQKLLKAEGHEDTIIGLAFTPDGRNLVSSDRFAFGNWDVATGRPKHLMREAASQSPAQVPPRRWTSAVFALLPNGRGILSGGTDGLLHLEELETGRKLRRFVLDQQPEHLRDRGRKVYRLGVAADGKTAAAVSYSNQPNSWMIDIWDLASGRVLIHRPDTSELHADDFSPDAKTLVGYRHSFSSTAVADPRAKAGTRTLETTQIVLEEVATGRTLLAWKTPKHGGGPQAFSPDGQTLATASFSVSGTGNQQRMGQSSLHLWELATGKERLRIAGTKSGPKFGYEKMAFAPDGRILATARRDRTIQLWDTATGKELLRRTGYTAPIYCLTFAPDGKTLASGHLDGTMLVWDVARATERLYHPDRRAEARELEGWWADLAGASGQKGHVAVWALVGVPRQAVTLLRDRLQPAATVPAERLRQLVSDLDNKQFHRREAAAKQLAELADQAEPALQDALKHDPSAEQRRRIEALLSTPRIARSPDSLRALRALQVLEHIGDPAACRVLANLAKGAPNARLTQEAKAALNRLAGRPARLPQD